MRESYDLFLCLDSRNISSIFFLQQTCQGAGILGAPAGGAPSRTWAPVQAIVAHHARATIDLQHNVFDFASPVAWDYCRAAVTNLTDAHGLGWTGHQVGFPDIATVLVVYPKNACSVQHSIQGFPQ